MIRMLATGRPVGMGDTLEQQIAAAEADVAQKYQAMLAARKSLGSPQPGEQNPDYPGCVWDASKGDWACDDGYYLNSGEAIIDSGADNGSIQTNASNVTIRELGQVTLNDLSAVIDAAGFYDTAADDPLVAAASHEWWKYSVAAGTNGVVRITKRNLVLYGGLAVAGLLVFSALKK